MSIQTRRPIAVVKTRRAFLGAAVSAGASLAAAPLLRAAANRIPDASVTVPKGTTDWHSHWISPRAITYLKNRASGPRLVSGQNGLTLLDADVGPSPQPFAISPEFTDIDLRLERLVQAGVSHQVISWATTLGFDAVLTADEAKPLWSAFNDDLADLVRKYPGQFSGYAALPTSDIDWAAGELDRAYRHLDLIGAVLPVGAFQTREGAKHLTPILEVTQQHQGILYVHSGPASITIPGQTVLNTPEDDAPTVRYQQEWTQSYARAAVTLSQTDLLDPYPEITVQIAMLGGATPLLAGWLQLNSEPAVKPSPAERLRRIYLDASTSRAPGLLDLAVATVGADRILFGTDYPIAPICKTVTAVHNSQLSDTEKDQIFVANGQKLLGVQGISAVV